MREMLGDIARSVAPLLPGQKRASDPLRVLRVVEGQDPKRRALQRQERLILAACIRVIAQHAPPAKALQADYANFPRYFAYLGADASAEKVDGSWKSRQMTKFFSDLRRLENADDPTAGLWIGFPGGRWRLHALSAEDLGGVAKLWLEVQNERGETLVGAVEPSEIVPMPTGGESGAKSTVPAVRRPRSRVPVTSDPDVAGPPPKSPLSDDVVKLDRLSGLAQADAEVVLRESEAGEAIYLDEVYVVRESEQIVQELISEPPAKLVVVLRALAGHGKTSVLWHLTREIGRRPDFKTWLLKPSMLNLESGASVADRVSSSDIARAAHEVRAANVTPVVLMDTVDVILHSEHNQVALRIFVQTIVDAGCIALLASRSQEADLLRFPEGTTKKTVSIDQYNAEELRRAVETHASRFCARSTSKSPDEYMRELLDVVSSGRTLSEVWRIPLTLRMLFTLYTPDDFPPEVNAYRLYSDYWSARVREDQRPGTPVALRTINLEGAAHAIAIAMLAEGAPEVPIGTVDRLVGDFELGRGDVDELITRGVLRRSGSLLAFFHQTFFEHAAARALLRRGRVAGIELIARRFEERPLDLFIAPVLEQVLLLAEIDVVSVKERAAAEVRKLLSSSGHAAQRIGLSVYALRGEADPALLDTVKALLEKPALVNDFLPAAANMTRGRVAELFDVLDALWQTKNWRIQQNILMLLNRLTARDADSVQVFLVRNDVVRQILRAPKETGAEKDFLEVIEALAPSHPEWVWDVLVRFYKSAGGGSKSWDLRERILTILVRQFSSFHRPSLATDFESVTKASSRPSREFNELWGALWLHEYDVRGLGSATITADLRAAPSHGYPGRLHAVRAFLLREGSADAEVFWREFIAVSDEEQYLWSTIVWPNVLGAAVPDRSISGVDIGSGGETCRARFAAAIDEWANEGFPSLRSKHLLIAKLVAAMREAPHPDRWVMEIFSGSAFDDPERWMSHEQLGAVLPKAFIAGHRGACAAMEMLESTGGRFAQLIARSLAEVEFNSAQDAELFVRLLLRLRDITPLLHVFGETAKALPMALSDAIRLHAAELNDLLVEQSRSDVHDMRRKSAMVWRRLYGRAFVAPPDFEVLLGLVAWEAQDAAKAELALLLGEATREGSYDIEQVVPTLRRLGTHEAAVVRDAALRGLRIALVSSRVVPAHLRDFVDLVLTTPDHEGRISEVGHLLAAVAGDEPAVGAAVLESVLRSPAVTSLRQRQASRLINRLRGPVTYLVARLSDAERVRLVRLVPELNSYLLGRLVVDAAAYTAFPSVALALDELLADPRVPDDLKRFIHNQKYRRQRGEGSDTWPEVYEIVAATGT